MVRDTARYRPYMRPHGRDGGKLRPRRLKDLAQEVLGMGIQEGKHDSVRYGRGVTGVWNRWRIDSSDL